MDNIIDIELTGRSTRRDQKLWQYDYGQVLRIAGKEFPKVTEVQFSLQQSDGHTLDRIGTSNNGLLTVQIPNELLQNKGATSDYTIYAFVYLSGDGFGNTKYMIQLPVESRPEPTDPSEDPSIDPSIFEDAINAVNASAERAETAEKSAKESADKAKEYADDARKSKEVVENARDDAVANIGKAKESALSDIASKTNESVQKIQIQAEASQNSIKQSIADATKKKTELDGAISNATDAKGNLDKAVQSAGDAKTELDTSVGKAGEAKTSLDSSISSAGEKQLALDATAKHANTVDASLKEQIGSAEQIQANVEQIGKNTQAISSLNEDISDLTDTIISIDKSNVSENVDNYENIESTIIKSNGKLESNSYTAKFVVKKYINLTKASYTVKGFCQGNQCLYVLCDKNGDVIKYEDAISQGSPGTKTVDITINERDTILYVGGYETAIAVVKKYLYDIKLTTRLSNIYRKKVTLNGDSIAFGAGAGGTGFMDYIASKYNMTLDKKAVSGATIANLSSRYPDKHCICTSIDIMAEDANYIIFEGGYNDWLLWTQIGTLTDTMSGDLDDTKFYGALESICRQALAKWENGKIGFIITHKINDAWRTKKQEGATYPTLDGYYQAIKNVCEKYSIPYLDLSKVSRLNTELQNYKKYTYNSDGVHPTKDGYQIFYVDTIARWMENL